MNSAYAKIDRQRVKADINSQGYATSQRGCSGVAKEPRDWGPRDYSCASLDGGEDILRYPTLLDVVSKADRSNAPQVQLFIRGAAGTGTAQGGIHGGGRSFNTWRSRCPPPNSDSFQPGIKLRRLLMGSLDIARATARRIDNINTGYDMWDRWSVNPSRDGVTLFPNKETDCSACCGIILKSAFPKLNLTGTFWTGNFRERLAESGYLAKAIPVGGKNAEQIRAVLQPGDILLNTVHHVEYWDGGSLFSAVIDERGKGTGGAAGDQTGKETRFRSLYVYGAGAGWDYIIRPDYAKRDRELAQGGKVKAAAVAEIRKEVEQMQLVKVNGADKVYLLAADGTFAAIPNQEYLGVVKKAIDRKLDGINQREFDVLKDQLRRLAVARKAAA